MPKADSEASKFKVGDHVRLRQDTLAWRAEFKLQTDTGEIIQVGKDGRISTRFTNGVILKGRAVDSFELVS